MANFKQFEYILGQNGLGQVNAVTGSKYQITWIQLHDKFSVINPQPAKMSPNYPVDVSSNPVVIRSQVLQKNQQLVQWLDIGIIDSNYTSQGFEFNVIRKQYLDNKGYTNG